MSNRYDETWHRLLTWTSGQTPSERLAAQILLSEGYVNLDPSHPLGGKDGGQDATCKMGGKDFVMAIYFPREQQTFASIKEKFLADFVGVGKNSAQGFAFVTNQELRLAERKELKDACAPVSVDLFHLERVTAILDRPEMAQIRKQFLQIDFSDDVVRQELAAAKNEILARLEGLQTGGKTFCYVMLYDFDLAKALARNFVYIRCGEFPLFDVRLRIVDMESNVELLSRPLGELNSPADYCMVKWHLRDQVYYRLFFHARNGDWMQDLQLHRSVAANCWLAATWVIRNGEIVHYYKDSEFDELVGAPAWRD